MHPDNLQLAAYLDGALDEAGRAALRAHVLTCAACAARLERLRADGRHISAALSAGGTAPDVRANVRARLRRGHPGAWLARGGAFGVALASLLLFALLIGSRGGTIGHIPDRLFVTDARNGQLAVLDAYSGARLGAVDVGLYPGSVSYDQRHERIYVLLANGVAAVDQRTLTIAGRWDAQRTLGTNASLALDQARGQLYVSEPNAGVITPLDAASLTPSQSLAVGPAPGPLALTPDGNTLLALDQEEGTLWTIDLASSSRTARLLDRADVGRRGWLALSPDGQRAYVLRASAAGDSAPAERRSRPELWRVDLRSGQVSGPFRLDATPSPWDLLALDGGHLAIARGDGQRGGVDIVETTGFSVTARLDPSYDEHHLVAGPSGSIFALNWLHGTVTRYDLGTAAAAWRTPPQAWQPWEGVFVKGGWRWPW